MILDCEIRRLTKINKFDPTYVNIEEVIPASYLSKIASRLTVVSVKVKTLGGGIYNLNTPRKSPPGVRP
jgi:hypothetical protein